MDEYPARPNNRELKLLEREIYGGELQRTFDELYGRKDDMQMEWNNEENIKVKKKEDEVALIVITYMLHVSMIIHQT